MTQEATESTLHTDPQAARREKLAALAALGIDPWGGRLDDHTPIGQVRGQADAIKYRFEDGTELDLPEFEAQPDDFNFRQWKADRNKEKDNARGEVVGPKFRVAGRIVLSRPGGKLVFMNLRDMTGDIQLMIGQKQVGESWELVDKLDLGDLIAADGMLIRTNTGELSIAVEKVHFLTKSLEPPPEKHHGLTDPEMRQRMRYVDLAYNEGVMPRFLARSKIVQSIRTTLAERRLRGGRGSDAARDRRRRRRAAVHHAPQRAGHRPVHADRAGAAPQAADGRRHRARLRTGPRLPQRGDQPASTTPSSRCSRCTRPTATTGR